MGYSVLYSVPTASQERLERLVHDELQTYYKVPANRGKGCRDVSLNVALEFSRKTWLYADEGSRGFYLIETARQDPRFKGLILKSS